MTTTIMTTMTRLSNNSTTKRLKKQNVDVRKVKVAAHQDTCVEYKEKVK